MLFRYLVATLLACTLTGTCFPVGEEPIVKHAPGTSVEVDRHGTNKYEKGVVLPLLPSDPTNLGDEWHRVRFNGFPEGIMVQTKYMRPAAPAAVTNPPPSTTAVPPISDNPGAFKVGDRVEADKAGISQWEKGTILAFNQFDKPDGTWYRVRIDNIAALYYDGLAIPNARVRPLSGPDRKRDFGVKIGPVTTDQDNTLSADRPILNCPCPQPQARNGDRPDPEVLKKFVRCSKGEKAASFGLDGAVTVDISSVQIGAPRKWNPLEDSGDGRQGTIVYPVKMTYSVKTFYRHRTDVSKDINRLLNFYVDSFGQWRSGSEENLPGGQVLRIPRN